MRILCINWLLISLGDQSYEIIGDRKGSYGLREHNIGDVQACRPWLQTNPAAQFCVTAFNPASHS